MDNSKLPQKVKIVEVGPRDGLQNEKTIISVENKVKFIDLLSDAGFSHIEVGSFVSPKWVPQMQDTESVFEKIKRSQNTIYSALVPNMQGLESALQAQSNEIAVFTTVSETFSQKNTHCSIEESIMRIQAVIKSAQKKDIRIRAYISCVIACPYEGDMPASSVAELANTLINMGCYEVSLGDTIGVATPNKINKLIQIVSQQVKVEKLAAHFHDTYGQALANTLVALQNGISTIDASIAGLGGCPYAPKSSGNLATEDLLYMLDGMGIETGVNLDKAIAAGEFINDKTNHISNAKVALAKHKPTFTD